MAEGLEQAFVASGFLNGRLHATRIEGFPRVERAVELCGRGADEDEASEFRVVVRLVECRWQGEDTSAGRGGSSTGGSVERTGSSSTLRRRKSDKIRLKVKEGCSDQRTELNMYSEEIVMGYFCRFALDTLSVQLNSKSSRQRILHHFRKKVQPLWVMWLKHRITKTHLIAHVCKLYDNEVSDGQKGALVGLFSTWYFAFCRSKHRSQPMDVTMNTTDQWR